MVKNVIYDFAKVKGVKNIRSLTGCLRFKGAFYVNDFFNF